MMATLTNKNHGYHPTSSHPSTPGPNTKRGQQERDEHRKKRLADIHEARNALCKKQKLSESAEGASASQSESSLNPQEAADHNAFRLQFDFSKTIPETNRVMKSRICKLCAQYGIPNGRGSVFVKEILDKKENYLSKLQKGDSVEIIISDKTYKFEYLEEKVTEFLKKCSALDEWKSSLIDAYYGQGRHRDFFSNPSISISTVQGGQASTLSFKMIDTANFKNWKFEYKLTTSGLQLRDKKKLGFGKISRSVSILTRLKELNFVQEPSYLRHCL